MTGQGIDLDYCDIEWFALETKRDHSVIFEIASKYCILDSFVDCDDFSSKMVGETKLHLESKPIPTIDAQNTQTSAQTLSTPEPGDPTENEPELCLSVSCRGTGQQWTAAGAGALGAVDLGMT